MLCIFENLYRRYLLSDDICCLSAYLQNTWYFPSPDPNQYKKIIKMILGANLNNPAATRDTLLSMLRGKPELSDQVCFLELLKKFSDQIKKYPFWSYWPFTAKTSSNCYESGLRWQSFLINALSSQKQTILNTLIWLIRTLLPLQTLMGSRNWAC